MVFALGEPEDASPFSGQGRQVVDDAADAVAASAALADLTWFRCHPLSQKPWSEAPHRHSSKPPHWRHAIIVPLTCISHARGRRPRLRLSPTSVIMVFVASSR